MSRSDTYVFATDLPTPSIVLELLKPITWFPPMWAFGCGIICSGVAFRGHWHLIALGLLLSGPLLCATSQAVNDWFDREVDAINEPTRPIPSGRMPGRWGLYVAVLWTALSVACAYSLGPSVLVAAGIGLILAWMYSAPPVRLKQNGWWGNLACAVCYEGIAWLTGALVMLGGAVPSSKVVIIALLYSLGAHGIMTLNDFKSIDGDRALRIRSLPVQLGEDLGSELACATMILAQGMVILFLILWGQFMPAAGVAGLLLIQLLLMPKLLADPRAKSPWYQSTGVTLYVFGMLVSAFALRNMA